MGTSLRSQWTPRRPTAIREGTRRIPSPWIPGNLEEVPASFTWASWGAGRDSVSACAPCLRLSQRCFCSWVPGVTAPFPERQGRASVAFLACLAGAPSTHPGPSRTWRGSSSLCGPGRFHRSSHFPSPAGPVPSPTTARNRSSDSGSPRVFLGSGTCLPNVCGSAARECRAFDRAGKLVPASRADQEQMSPGDHERGWGGQGSPLPSTEATSLKNTLGQLKAK